MRQDRQNEFVFRLFSGEKKVLKSTEKLIFCTVFSKNSESIYLGEEKTIKKFIFAGKKEENFDQNALSFEGITLGKFLIDSYDFIQKGNFNKCVTALENMRGAVDEGNDKSTDSVKALHNIAQSDNIAAQLFAASYFFAFRKEKHLSVNKNGILSMSENSVQRKERFDSLYDRFRRGFDIIGSNPISPKNIREIGLKPQRSEKLLNGVAYICEDLPQFYANYIDYLRSKNMFLKVCERCHIIFFAENYRTKYHANCAEAITKANKEKSFRKYHGALWGECESERQNYKNFIKCRAFKNADSALQTEYMQLFNRFKNEMKQKKKGLNKEIGLSEDSKNENAYKKRKKVDVWLKKIVKERQSLENLFIK